MHIPSYDNQNRALVDVGDPDVPLAYFNIVKLKKGVSFVSVVHGYETCLVPAHGTIDVKVDRDGTEIASFDAIGGGASLSGAETRGRGVAFRGVARFVCLAESAEVFVAGARFDESLEPFAVRAVNIDPVQYGSDDTKTHRKIKHILGQKPPGRVGRLLVSELFTVGAGGWSGFPPHKHDTDQLPG